MISSPKITTEMDFGPYPVTEVRNYWFKLSDGVCVALKIWLPWKRDDDNQSFVDEKSGKKWFNEIYEGKREYSKEEKFPAILEFLPYRKDDTTFERDRYRHGWFASYGFVCVRGDIRGSGSSEGYYTDGFVKQERSDIIEIINWLASQSWCNSNVAMYGKSWGGINGLLVAYEQPKALKTIISVYATDDRFRHGIYFNGGCVINGLVLWCSQILMWNARPPDPRFFDSVESWKKAWTDRLEHGVFSWAEKRLVFQKDGPYWRELSICEDYKRIQCPVLNVCGLEDGYAECSFRMAAKLNSQSRALIGPWDHECPEVAKPGPQIDFLKTCLRWFEYHLKDPSVSIQDVSEWPRLTVFVREGSEPQEFYEKYDGYWIEVPDWDTLYDNPPSKHLITFHFGENRCLTRKEEQWKEKVLLTPHPLQGLNTGEWLPFTGGDIARDQTTANEHSLCFESQPLVEDLVIFGLSKAYLSFSFAHSGIQGVVVRLCHQLPNGTSTRIGYAVFNFSKQEAKTEATFEITLKATAYVIPKGHKLAFVLSPTYFPFIFTLPQVHGISLLTEKSKIVIQTLDKDRLKKKTTFDPPKQFLKLESEDRSSKEAPWKVHELNDNGREGWTRYESCYEMGPTFFPELQLENAESCKAFCDTKNDCSETEMIYSRTFRSSYPEQQINIRINSMCEVKANSEQFETNTELEVFLNEVLIFEKQWKGVVPREAC